VPDPLTSEPKSLLILVSPTAYAPSTKAASFSFDCCVSVGVAAVVTTAGGAPVNPTIASTVFGFNLANAFLSALLILFFTFATSFAAVTVVLAILVPADFLASIAVLPISLLAAFASAPAAVLEALVKAALFIKFEIVSKAPLPPI
jgi:hypothetical protein